jgi:hypothetical protein
VSFSGRPLLHAVIYIRAITMTKYTYSHKASELLSVLAVFENSETGHKYFGNRVFFLKKVQFMQRCIQFYEETNKSTYEIYTLFTDHTCMFRSPSETILRV